MLAQSFPNLEKTVFVITYGRSGSTLLQNFLNALPGHLVRGENANILAPLVRSWHELRISAQAEKMRANRRLSRPTQPWFGYESIDSDALGRDLADVFARNVLRPEETTRVAGFKEIRWHGEPELFAPMLEFLQRYMPAAHFIFNTRDHAEVVRSGWWKTMDPDVVRAELERAEALYSSWQTAHSECSLAMHYNSYIDGPEAWRPLFRFLDIPFDAGAVQDVLDVKLTHMKWKSDKDQAADQ